MQFHSESAGASVTKSAGMRQQEYVRLRELLAKYQPRKTLEIGMANGDSTVEICRFLKDNGGNHVAVDPFQLDPKGWKSEGVENVRRNGLSEQLELMADFDYLALPQLVKDGRRFDFVLIDGWHSFDYTLLDFFYADLLLEPGGVLVIHDTGWPAVYKVCRFIETHKPYNLISPPPSVVIEPLAGRLCRRVMQLLRGPAYYRALKARRTEWFSLAAYQKREDAQVGDSFHRDF